MILYLTHNDQPSGVYWSQVAGVVNHLNTLGEHPVKLVALVSARGFFSARRAIRARCAGAWVLPMVPTPQRWKWNTRLLAAVCRWLRPSGLICRGPFATWMALRMRDRGLTRKVCFDGRGAYAAEWQEYRVVDDQRLIDAMPALEREAVNATDHRIAVSEALVAHWRERYAYSGTAHTVIPCTLNAMTALVPAPAPAERVRFVYSGSAAGWQSFPLVERLVAELMQQPGAEVLFLSPDDPSIHALQHRFPGRIAREWVQAERVPSLLATCDHALLVREPTLTNRVASPTKFAEYLAAGLPVIISPGIGDFSGLVERQGLGTVYLEGRPLPEFRPTPREERERLHRFAAERFTKTAYADHYRAVLASLV